MHNNSTIQLIKSNYENNISFLKKLFGKKTILSSVIKGNAYGHGIDQIVPMAQACGVNHFSVFDVEEAKQAKAVATTNVTLMVMGFVAQEEMEWVVANEVEFYVFEKKRIENAVTASKKTGKKAIIHLEIETGMNRTGFEKREWPAIVKFLNKNQDYLDIKGICTHYAGAESMGNYYRITEQTERFQEATAYFNAAGIHPKQQHTACSAAAIMFPETRMDLVRIGIMQYGLWPSPEVFVKFINDKKIKTDPLKRIITWKSKVMSIKKVNQGEFIGYGTSYMAKEKMKIAVVPIGYAHGYSRSLSNHGRVIVNDHRCMVVGTVNMNMMVIDVTDVQTLKKGDEVILIGSQNGLSISIASFSEYSNQLNYELLTRITPTIPRKTIN